MLDKGSGFKEQGHDIVDGLVQNNFVFFQASPRLRLVVTQQIFKVSIASHGESRKLGRRLHCRHCTLVLLTTSAQVYYVETAEVLMASYKAC